VLLDGETPAPDQVAFGPVPIQVPTVDALTEIREVPVATRAHDDEPRAIDVVLTEELLEGGVIVLVKGEPGEVLVAEETGEGGTPPLVLLTLILSSLGRSTVPRVSVTASSGEESDSISRMKLYCF
jgi:hypothetical protein